MDFVKYLKDKKVSFEIGFNGKITVGGSLDLIGCTGLTSLPDGLTVGGSLDLSGCTGLTSLPDGLTVGGSLDLIGCTGLTSLPDGLTVGGSLYLIGCTGLTSLPDGLTVGGSLDLIGCTGLTSLPDGLTVGGFLYLIGCTGLTSLPDGLTVGGSLYLSGCTGLTSLPDGLTVGGSLDLSNTKIKDHQKKPLPEGFRLSLLLKIEAKFNLRGFTIADGILAEILHKKSNFYKVRIVGKKEHSWLCKDDAGSYAHGATLEEAAQELLFKTDSRDVNQYRNMKKDTVKTPMEWAFIYRSITGACKSGTQHFMSGKELKASYTLAEIIAETRGAYGHDRFVEVVS